MKKYFMLFLLGVTISCCNAQLTTTRVVDSVDSPDKYYFKDFGDGIVYLKNGTQSEARLNYQMQDQAIAYIDENGKHLILDKLEAVDSVQISGFLYIPVSGKFFEKLTDVSPMLLLSMHGKAKPQSAALAVTDIKTLSKNWRPEMFPVHI